MSPARLELHVPGESGAPTAVPDAGMLVIGSSGERAGLVLDGQGVEDAHCAVGAVKGGGFAIKDLGSRYGTMVNGKKVRSARLKAGDTIVVGSRRLQVVDPDQPAAPASAPEPQAAAAPPAPPEPKAKPKPAAAAPPPKPSPDLTKTAAIPKKLAGYRIDRVLGRGGMGTVVLAEQESLHRPVALKLLSPRLAADADFVRNFQKEARAAAALNHPNVVVVHDVGEAEGVHYLSMEYMEKGSLEERLGREGRLPWREVLDVLHDAARGLMFAEERGIIHRDIKPANLMQNEAGTIKIADLGLATHVEAEATESEGAKIYGTPHFISPEQARGETVDPRSDLYSLGATAYQLLTGHTPFEGETTRDILRGHFTEEPEPPRRHVPDVPGGLEALVLRLLAKEPDGRPPGAEALLAEVDRLRLEADHGVAVGPGGGSSGVSKALIGVGFGAVILVGVLAATLMGGGDDPQDGGSGGGVVAGGGGDSNGPNGSNGPGPENGGTDVDEGDIFNPTAEGGNGDAGQDLEAGLRERNLLAENAYLRIEPSLDKSERVAVLEDLIETYPGTDTATRAQGEVERLRSEIAAEAQAAQATAAALGEAERNLRQRCALPTPEGELPRPGDQLRQALAFEPDPRVTPEAMGNLVARVGDEIVAAAIAAFRAELGRADDLKAQGEFGQVEALLQNLLPRFDLPEYDDGGAPKRYAELQLLGDEVRGRSARLAGEAEQWSSYRRGADRMALAEAIGPGGPLARALAQQDLEGALNLLGELEARLQTDAVTSLTDALRQDLIAAQVLRTALVREFAGGGWRRRSIVDPRTSRTTARDVVAADAQGLTVGGRDGTESLPWSAFAANTPALNQLLKDRLARDYSTEEERGAIGLLRISIALSVRDLCGDLLNPANTEAHFSKAESSALEELFELEDWALASPRIVREREACALLATALEGRQSGAWSEVARSLEQLLGRYADTLVVAMVSDGSPWESED